MNRLLSVEEAWAILRREAGPGETRRVRLAEARGHALAEDASADRDFPAFDVARMDGFAVRSADLAKIPATLEVLEEIMAGRLPTRILGPGQAARIMTGAPMPRGADAVVMIERTAPAGPGRVEIREAVAAETHVARQGSDVKAGAIVIARGTPLGPAEVAVLAAIGRAEVPVWRKPRLAVMGSGDELVEPGIAPKPWQIRNSNSYQLLAQAAAHGLEAEYLGIAPDDPAETRRLIEQGLEADVFISTGGVSVGDKDHVGAAMKDLGVELLFTKINVKPGKPTVFGRRAKTLVFGLPGNPVSALATFHLFRDDRDPRADGRGGAAPAFVPAPAGRESAQAGRPRYFLARQNRGRRRAGPRAAHALARLGAPDRLRGRGRLLAAGSRRRAERRRARRSLSVPGRRIGMASRPGKVPESIR
ncbi:MAG: molybdopterin molybdotransferase MoeA [Planctomycetota bacterium]|nr:molybdopterin molybdotransferase MoeA [Planctomycetota bacterium]